MEDKAEFYQEKIEIDEKTNDLKVVEVKAEAEPLPQKTEIRQEERLLRNVGAQISMDWLLTEEEDKKPDKKQKRLKLIFNIVFCVVLFGVMAYTFYLDFFSGHQQFLSAEELSSIFAKSYVYLFYLVACFTACLFIKCLKTSLLCKSLTGKWQIKLCFDTTIIGQYYNHITPLALGEQPYMIYGLSKGGLKGGIAASIPIATVFLKQLALAVISVTAIILYSVDAFSVVSAFGKLSGFLSVFSAIAWLGIFICLLTPTIIAVFSMFPRFSTKIVGFAIAVVGKIGLIKDVKVTTQKAVKNASYNAKYLKQTATDAPVFILSFLLSIVEQFTVFTLPFLVLKLFGYEAEGVNLFIEWVQVTIISLIIYSAISVVPTPGNSGAADISFYKLFEVALAGGLAFSATLVWRFFCFYGFIIVGFILGRAKKSARKRQAKKLW